MRGWRVRQMLKEKEGKERKPVQIQIGSTVMLRGMDGPPKRYTITNFSYNIGEMGSWILSVEYRDVNGDNHQTLASDLLELLRIGELYPMEFLTCELSPTKNGFYYGELAREN